MSKKKLTKKQELFCEMYATEREYFGNGTQAYAKAYNIDLSEKGKNKLIIFNAKLQQKQKDLLQKINDKLL